MRRSAKYVCAGVLLLSATQFAAPQSRAQASHGSSSPDPVTTRQTNEPPSAGRRIRSHVNEVVVPVTVTDKNGELVLDLSQKDFHVFDNGVEQTIYRWDLGGDALAVALVIETSSRVEVMAPAIHSMGSIFTETVMALSGEAAVITYDSTVEVRQPFTQDHDAVEKAISKVEFQAPERQLYDGMAEAEELLKAQPPTYRRIMLVVGESQDDGSKAKLGQIARQAAEANISIYAVGLSSVAADFRGDLRGTAPLKEPGLPPITTARCVDIQGNTCVDMAGPAIWLLERGLNEIKNHQLDVAAAATGGIHYRAFSDESIRNALDRIGGELHAQYVLSYVPSADPLAGFNEIKVTVSRPDLALRTRPGYYVFAAP